MFVGPVSICVVFFLFCLAPVIVMDVFVTKFIAALGVPVSSNFLWLILLLPGAIMVASLALLYANYRNYEITLTDKRLRFRVGFLFRCSGDISLENIESVFLGEPLLGRLLGYGTVIVIGTGGTPFRLPYLPDATVLQFELQRATKGALCFDSVKMEQAQSSPSDDSRYTPKE